MATVISVKRVGEIANQVQYTARVKYPNDTRVVTVHFYGTPTGAGPVVMSMSGCQTLVTEPDRFGPFNAEWVTRFFTTPVFQGRS